MSERRDSPTVGYAPFDCAPAMRLAAHEQVTKLQVEGLGARMDRIEQAMERLEKRLWLTVYGVVAVILAQAFEQILNVAP
ncbi:GTA head formation protein, RCAP_rcc01685 family [Pseudaestuariivita sp.]|uniref:GTA head formation protein, RCAP_rcc01685 family n=1 Tax=Pseudaestuariivita sp. TaxID=2211669 RepID=UPI0040584856